MSGQHLFETEDTELARRDRQRHGSWERVPPALQRWWCDRAERYEAVLDWNEVKRAAREGARR